MRQQHVRLVETLAEALGPMVGAMAHEVGGALRGHPVLVYAVFLRLPPGGRPRPLRTLLTHEEPEERPRQAAAPSKPAAARRPARQKQLALDEGQDQAVREALEGYSSEVLGRGVKS